MVFYFSINTKASCLASGKSYPLQAKVEINESALSFSVHLNDDEKLLLGEGEAKINENYVYLQYIINQEPEDYKHIGTALIETLLVTMIKRKLDVDLKLVSLGVSRGFFKKLGFMQDNNGLMKFAVSKNSRNLMLTVKGLQQLHIKLTTPVTENNNLLSYDIHSLKSSSP